MKLLHIINGLSTGGAEMMLYKILSRINRERFQPSVISLRDYGTLGQQIADLGIPVYTIGMNPGMPSPKSIWRLSNTIQKLQPDLIQGWMYHGNLAATLAKITLKSVPIIWNIRHSVYSLKYEKKGTAAIIRLLANFSRFTSKIIYNSEISVNQHEKIGYAPTKTVVIPNGFDTELFAPFRSESNSLRTELSLTDKTLLIGLMGRYHPMKDHANFIKAAAILLKECLDVHFVLVGSGVNIQNIALQQLIQTLGIKEQIHLLGERQDMPRITAALDIACSTSYYGEGFPNVIGEAMSCGVPCVVTNVGDSARIVSNTGRVVSPKSPEVLANAWKDLIELGATGRASLGQAARARILSKFSLDVIVAQYENLYEKVLSENCTKKLNVHL